MKNYMDFLEKQAEEYYDKAVAAENEEEMIYFLERADYLSKEIDKMIKLKHKQ